MKKLLYLTILGALFFSCEYLDEDQYVQDFEASDLTLSTAKSLADVFNVDSINLKYVVDGDFEKTLIVEIAANFRKEEIHQIEDKVFDTIVYGIFDSLSDAEKIKIENISASYTNEYQYEDDAVSVGKVKLFIKSYYVKDKVLIKG